MKIEITFSKIPEQTLAYCSVVISSVGVFLWVALLLLLLAMPYESTNTRTKEDFYLDWYNVMLFFVRAFVGVIGVAVNGTLSTIGTIFGLVGACLQRKAPLFYCGLGLGLAGLVLGSAIVVWRYLTLIAQ